MTPTKTSKQSPLDHIIQIIEKHDLSLKDIKQALTQHKKNTNKDTKSLSRNEIVMRLFIYIGSVFIFAGIGTYVAMVWGDLQSLPRVIITLGSGFTAYIIGLIFVKNPRLEKAATPAHIIAFLLQPTGLFVFLSEYSSGDNLPLASMLVFGLLTVQQLFTFIGFRKTSLIFFSMLYFLGFLGGFVEYFDFHRALASLCVGLGLLLFTIDLQDRKTYKDLTPFFYIISTSIFFAGLYHYTGNTVYDPLNLSISFALLMISVMKSSKTLYVLSILYIIAFLSHGPAGHWMLWSWHSEWVAVASGLGVILAGLWLQKAKYTSVTPLWLFFGSAYGLGGAFSVLHETPYEVLYIAVVCLSIYGALFLKSRSVLTVSILYFLGFITYFTEKHFQDTLGWPVMLIVLGFVMLGSGVLFVRFSSQIKSSKA